jgi:hypothetical protein
MKIAEGNVVVAQRVQRGPGKIVTQKRGIAFDEGVQMLLADEIGGDALDFLRRAAVEGGERNGAADLRFDGADEAVVDKAEMLQVMERPVAALPPDGTVSRFRSVSIKRSIFPDLIPARS